MTAKPNTRQQPLEELDAMLAGETVMHEAVRPGVTRLEDVELRSIKYLLEQAVDPDYVVVHHRR